MSMRRFGFIATLALASGGLPAPAYAEDPQVRCTVVEVRSNDRVAQGRDVIVEANGAVHDAVAVDGNVILRKGARAHSAVAVRGSVTIEPGARVSDSAVAIGGKVSVAQGAEVAGSTLSLDRGLHIRGEDGKSFDLDINVGGVSLGEELLKSVLKNVERCVIVHEASPAPDAGPRALRRPGARPDAGA